jgi:protein-disulfide isomerase
MKQDETLFNQERMFQMGWKQWILLPMLCLTVISTAQAEVDARVVRTLQLKATPVDLAIPGNGRYIYVLTADARLQVFKDDGELQDTLAVDPGVDRIQPGSREDVLFLINSVSKQVQVLELDFIQKIPVDGSPSKGPADAAVTVTVFTDFQCPYCARLAPVLDQLVEKYPRQIKLVFKNYPLNSHKFARKAAEAALAAESQGRFWEFQEALFAGQSRLDEAKIEEIRANLKLDKRAFDARRKAKQVTDQIQKDIHWAGKAGVRGTPAVFINGRMQRKRSLENLSAAVDAELRRQGK